MAKLLGEIVEKDRMICLQTSPSCWFPLGGNSGIAEEFRETFNQPARGDIARRLYRTPGGLAMESQGQAAARRKAMGDAYAAGRNCYRRCVGSIIYGHGHREPEIEAEFARGYKDEAEFARGYKDEREKP